MRRLMVAVALVLGLGLGVADAATILVFGQSTGLNLFTGDETAGTTVLDANNVPVTITTLNETGVSIAAFFNLDATSTALATNVAGDVWTQPYDGDFQITSGLGSTGFNYLSGLFSAVQLGIVDGRTFILGAAQPPGSLTFTSDIVAMPLLEPRGMALSLTNVLPSVQISNGSFADFTSNVGGTFSAEPVPEPASLLLLSSGLGMLASVLRKRRR